jgi:hypothetical protein
MTARRAALLREAAAADFNADGKPDLLWRNDTMGQNAVWYLDGAAFVSQALLPTRADTRWAIGLVADLNQDGRPDVVWRNGATGQNWVWHLDGLTILDEATLPTESNGGWDLVGPRRRPLVVPWDFNRNGQPDLLWRNVVTGQNVVWYMDGLAFLSQTLLSTAPDTSWQIAFVADFDGDRQAELVWRNSTTGENVIRHLSGRASAAVDVLPTVPNADWVIVRDRR